MLTVSVNGYGKRTTSYEYRTTGRGGKGIVAMSVNERNGKLVASFPVEESDQIMLVTDKGQLIRCPVEDIRIAGRSTQGVIVFNTADDEHVVSVEHIGEETENGNGNGKWERRLGLEPRSCSACKATNGGKPLNCCAASSKMPASRRLNDCARWSAHSSSRNAMRRRCAWRSATPSRFIAMRRKRRRRRASGSRTVEIFMQEALPAASSDVRTKAGDLIARTLSSVGKHFSETPRTPLEIDAYADAMADMFCAYLRAIQSGETRL